MKIAIVIGHNSKAQGAVRATDGRTEYDWNSELAELIRTHNPTGVKIFRRRPVGGYSKEIDRVYAEVDKWGADCSIELHFNAFKPTSTGGLTLSSGSSGSMALAQLVRKSMKIAVGNRDRGVKVRGRKDRGGRSLWQGKAPAIMTEPYFGSNPVECHMVDEAMDQMAEGLYRAAKAFVASR